MSVEEEWRPVAGFTGFYEASNLGRIRSLDRERRGRWGSARKIPGRVLKGYPTRGGHLRITLHGEGATRSRQFIHRIVAEAFIPNPDGLEMVLHYDDNPLNNNVSNLRWGNHQSNMQDMIRNGNHVEARKQECPKGHPYSVENTRVNSKGHRRCVTCIVSRRSGGLTPSDERHGTHNGYDNFGCRCDECTLAGPYPKRRKKNEQS